MYMTGWRSWAWLNHEPPHVPRCPGGQHMTRPGKFRPATPFKPDRRVTPGGIVVGVLIGTLLAWSIWGIALRFQHPDWTETQILLAMLGLYP